MLLVSKSNPPQTNKMAALPIISFPINRPTKASVSPVSAKIAKPQIRMRTLRALAAPNTATNTMIAMTIQCHAMSRNAILNALCTGGARFDALTAGKAVALAAMK